MRYLFLLIAISFSLSASDDLIIQSLDFYENFEVVMDEDFETQQNDQIAEGSNEKP